MKFAIRLLLAGALAVAPAACNRNNTTDQPVSANADRTDRTDQTTTNDSINERTPAKERTPARERQTTTTRTTRPAVRTPERAPERDTTSSAENRSVETRPADRENRPIEPTRTRTTETVPNGTAVTVTLADTVSTDMNKEGDNFTAHLSQPIVVNGKVVAAKGDRVTGHVTKLDEPGRVKGRARLELVLDEIQTSRDSYKLSTEPFIAVGEDSHTRDAAEVAGGAAVGAAIGAIAGGGKGAAVGAVIGGGTGTTAVLVTRGKQLRIDPETKVNFVLSRDVDLPVIRNGNT